LQFGNNDFIIINLAASVLVALIYKSNTMTVFLLAGRNKFLQTKSFKIQREEFEEV
jgi:hypothetical protein